MNQTTDEIETPKTEWIPPTVEVMSMAQTEHGNGFGADGPSNHS